MATCPVTKFADFVGRQKEDWIMKRVTCEHTICKNLINMARNMIADKQWKSDTTKDQKIVALTTRQGQLEREIKALASGNPSRNGGGGGGARGGNQTAMDRVKSEDRYLVTFKGKNITHQGKKLVWCDKHKSKDGTIKGRYYESPHDHQQWEEARRRSKERWQERRKRGAGGGGGGDSKPEAPASSSKQPGPKKMKLALNNKLAQALVCKHNFSQEEADSLFAESYKGAEESLN